MRKPTIFIGSSSESSAIAADLQVRLEKRGLIDCQVWDQSFFVAGESTLETLANKSVTFDFAVLVFAADDSVEMRGKERAVARDNVVFEMGLFIGSLGRERTFALVPDAPDFHTPADLAGITTFRYDPQRYRKEGEPALGSAATQIGTRVQELGVRIELRESMAAFSAANMERFYRQTGLTEAFRERKAATDRILGDIQQARRRIDFIARVYISELMKSTSSLAAAVANAARLQPREADSLELTFVSTPPDDELLAQAAWKAEDPDGKEWTLEEYQRHLLRRPNAKIGNLHQALEAALGPMPLSERQRIRIAQRYLCDYILPYSMVVIDQSVIYVSFYSMSLELTGTYAPTMRLVADGVGPDTWAQSFLRMGRDIVENRSRCVGKQQQV